MLLLSISYWFSVQPIDATHKLNLSAGVQLPQVKGLVVWRGALQHSLLKLSDVIAPAVLIFYRDLNCTVFKQLRIGCGHAECSNSTREIDLN